MSEFEAHRSDVNVDGSRAVDASQEGQIGQQAPIQANPQPQSVPQPAQPMPIQNQNAPQPSAYGVPNAAQPMSQQTAGLQTVPQQAPQTLPTVQGDTGAVHSGKGSSKKRSGLVIGIIACIGAVALVSVLSILIYKGITGGASLGENEKYTNFSFNEVDTPQTDTTIKGNEKELTPAQVAAKVRPSIVSVVTVDNISYNSQESGEGSGIIVDSDGYVITNSHVIGDSADYDVTVITSDGTEYKATVIGYDTRSDIAALKIDAKGLPECEWGDSTKLVLGDYVLTIGNPGGRQFAGSVTSGVVSGVDRIIDSSDSDSTSAMRYIQTDAVINPGSSGGALVNMYGQVVGINTSKIVSSEFEAMSFAVPSSTAKYVVEDLIQHGYVQGRVKLGITCITISDAYESQGIPAGLQIYEIGSDSDMNGKAQKYDIITHCDGKRVTNISQLQDVIFEKKAGDTVKLKLYRPANTKDAATEYEIEVKLLEDTGAKASAENSQKDSDNGSNFSGEEGKRY